MSQGYGITPKAVMQDPRLSIEAKAIYAYIASFAGSGTTAFPGKRKIAADLNISEERLYNHRKQLIKYGYITVEQERGPGGTLGKTIYTLEPIAIERPDTGEPSSENPSTGKPRSEKPRTGNPSYNNNSQNINSFNNNIPKSNRPGRPATAEIVELYHKLCPSLAKVVKLSEKRKTAIKARLDDYSIEQIKKAFEMAEQTPGLKGDNDRGWKADFDWLMRPDSIARILEGKYANWAKTKKPNGQSKPVVNIEEEESL